MTLETWSERRYNMQSVSNMHVLAASLARLLNVMFLCST